MVHSVISEFYNHFDINQTSNCLSFENYLGQEVALDKSIIDENLIYLPEYLLKSIIRQLSSSQFEFRNISTCLL